MSDCNKLEKIEMEAFAYCVELEEINIPASVTFIDQDAFAYCFKLRKVKFQKNSKLRTLGYYCFQSCTSLKEITIPKSVKELQGKVFLECENLKKITFLGSVPSFGKKDFTKINGNAVFKVPAKYKTSYKKKLKGKSWYKPTMTIQKI